MFKVVDERKEKKKRKKKGKLYFLAMLIIAGIHLHSFPQSELAYLSHFSHK